LLAGDRAAAAGIAITASDLSNVGERSAIPKIDSRASRARIPARPASDATVIGNATGTSHYNGCTTRAAFATRTTPDFAMIDQSPAFIQNDASTTTAAIAERKTRTTAVSANDCSGTFDCGGSGVLKNQTGPTPAARSFSAS
jgi:hypothetical protein